MPQGRPGQFENCVCGCPRIAHHPDPNGRCNACCCPGWERVGSKQTPSQIRYEAKVKRAQEIQDRRSQIRIAE